MKSAEYQGREIGVVAAPLQAGGYGILRIEVWQRTGPSDTVTPLHVTEPLTFDTEDDACNAGLQMARAAIDSGRV